MKTGRTAIYMRERSVVAPLLLQTLDRKRDRNEAGNTVCFGFFHLRSILLNIFISLKKKTQKKDKTLFFPHTQLKI